MQRVPVSWILTIVGTLPLIAQNAPFGTAVAAHSATYAPSGPEQFGIAQGSIFVVFGSNLGPTELVQANSFPLQTRLAGTSIELEVNGVTHPAVMIYTSANQVAALVPSNTLAGDGTLTVTYASWNSRAPIKIVPSAFGIYTVAQTGRGPGIVTNSAYRVHSTSFAANPGETLIIWGTGLGPVSGDEAGGPLPGNLRSDAQVFVGTTPAHVRYAGRSGCCAGLDQITFDVPTGIAGCFVPLAVRVGGVVSNFTSLSIAAPGRQCSDPAGLPAVALNRAASSGSLRVGAIALGQTGLLGAMSDRIRWRRINSPFALALASLLGPGTAAAPASTAPARQLRNRARQLIQTYQQQQQHLTGKRNRLSRKAIRRALAQMPDQTITADFSSLPYAALLVPHLISTISAVGSCSVATCATHDCGLSAALPQDHYVISPLDAGPQLSFSGPAGLLALPRWSAGQYGAEFASGPQGQLPVGDYVVNGPGGADVDPFTARFTLYSPLNWTNKDTIDLIDRTRDLTVTWNQSRTAGYVLVGGISSSHLSTSSSVFICSEKAAKGSFTIPSFVLSTLPVETAGGAPGTLPAPGYLFMAIHPLANTFTARGIDLGYFTDLSADVKEVQYH